MGQDRNLALDGLRGLAVLAVLLFHGRVLQGGQVGVDVFFVLSGFLITRLLLGEIDSTGQIGVVAFMVRRVRRLVPALAVLLAVYLALAGVLTPRFAAARWVDAASAALYLTNVREIAHASHGPLSHTWSLAIEGQFYLLWPAVTTGLAKLPRPTAFAVLVAAWLVLTLARAGLFVAGHGDLAYFGPFHSSGLILGAAMAVRPPGVRLGAAAILALLAVTFAPQDPVTTLWTGSAAELGASLVLIDPPRALAWRPLTWLGSISYGVYLWHVPIWKALESTPQPWRTAAMFAITIPTAAASYHWLERRFLGGRPRGEARTVLTAG